MAASAPTKAVTSAGAQYGPLQVAGYLSDGSHTAASLAEVVVEMRAANRSRSMRPTGDAADEKATSDDDRRWAVAMLVVSLARKDWQVEAFRADVLRGQLLGDVAAAAEWIRDRAGEEGRSLYSTIAFDDDDIRARSDGSYTDGRFDVSSVDTAMLRFVDPAGDRVESVAVHHGGVLDRLRRLSEQWKPPGGLVNGSSWPVLWRTWNNDHPGDAYPERSGPPSGSARAAQNATSLTWPCRSPGRRHRRRSSC